MILEYFRIREFEYKEEHLSIDGTNCATDESKMNMQQRKEWVAGLKHGDLVVVGNDSRVYKVVINRHGKPEVYGRRLSITGCLPTSLRDHLGGKVTPATPEQITAYTAQRFRSKLAYGMNWNALTDEQILAVAKIVGFE